MNNRTDWPIGIARRQFVRLHYPCAALQVPQVLASTAETCSASPRRLRHTENKEHEC